MMINHCASNPCQHNGLCIPLLDAYRCVCLDDYIGLNCERTSDECFSNPCLNGGSCIDHVWNYTCQCAMGFTGSNCQMEVNYCQSSPCIEGLCINKVRRVNLVINDASVAFLAPWLRLSLPVISVPRCALWNTDQSMFISTMPQWWHLHWWSNEFHVSLSTLVFWSNLFRENRSLPGPTVCAHNGTCHPNFDIKPYGHTCQCPPGFTGQMCEIDVDDCVSHPCHHGRCIDRVNGFVCQCYPGYEGILCDVSGLIIECIVWRRGKLSFFFKTIINQCTSHPCQNDGTCQPLINTYQCHCSPGYFGTSCEQKMGKTCATQTCLSVFSLIVMVLSSKISSLF